MKQITLQGAILLSVAMICVSSIAVAVITDDDCGHGRGPRIGAFDRPPPPHDMQRGNERGFGRRGGGMRSQRGRGGRNGGAFGVSNLQSSRPRRGAEEPRKDVPEKPPLE